MSADPFAQPSFSPQTRTMVTLPDAIFQQYAARAFLLRMPPEQYIAEHLVRTESFVDANPIYFSDADADQIRRALGPLAKTPQTIIEAVIRLVSMGVGGTRFRLTPNQQEALIQRAKAKGIDMNNQVAVQRSIAEDIENSVAAMLGTR